MGTPVLDLCSGMLCFVSYSKCTFSITFLDVNKKPIYLCESLAEVISSSFMISFSSFVYVYIFPEKKSLRKIEFQTLKK